VRSGESDTEGHRRKAVPFRLFREPFHPAETGSVAFLAVMPVTIPVATVATVTVPVTIPVATVATVTVPVTIPVATVATPVAMTVPAVVTVPAAIPPPTVVTVGPGVVSYLEAGGRGSGGVRSSVR
jgi:hypothetical protein